VRWLFNDWWSFIECSENNPVAPSRRREAYVVEVVESLLAIEFVLGVRCARFGVFGVEPGEGECLEMNLREQAEGGREGQNGGPMD
jgi:hypothetical protein